MTLILKIAYISAVVLFVIYEIYLQNADLFKKLGNFILDNILWVIVVLPLILFQLYILKDFSVGVKIYVVSIMVLTALNIEKAVESGAKHPLHRLKKLFKKK